MTRKLVVAAGQFGPTSDDKRTNVETILRLMNEAAGSGARFISLPELGLTKYFGHWHTRDFARVLDAVSA